jgi:hypothetical protein
MSTPEDHDYANCALIEEDMLNLLQSKKDEIKKLKELLRLATSELRRVQSSPKARDGSEVPASDPVQLRKRRKVISSKDGAST